MRCAVCTRCGKCELYPAAPISETGTAELPRLVPRDGLGAAAALFDPAFGDETDRIAHEAHHVELGGDPEFSDAFIETIGFDE